jgi:hypothetical protein
MLSRIPGGRVSFEKIKKQPQRAQELFLIFSKFGYFMLETFRSISVRHFARLFLLPKHPQSRGTLLEAARTKEISSIREILNYIHLQLRLYLQRLPTADFRGRQAPRWKAHCRAKRLHRSGGV